MQRQVAAQEMLTKTSTEWAPWHVVPADRKWYRNWAVSEILTATLGAMDPQTPPAPRLDDVIAQLKGSLAKVPADAVASMVIAYEPVWAIGTGEVASPNDAQEMAHAIREHISGAAGGEAGAGVRILYGGSVKGDNIASIMAEQDVDGALVGGASLDAGQFAAICRYREQVNSR